MNNGATEPGKEVHEGMSDCSGYATWRPCPYAEEISGVEIFEWICDCDYFERVMDV